MERIPDYYELLKLHPADPLAAIQQELQRRFSVYEKVYMRDDNARRQAQLIKQALTDAFADEPTRQRYDAALEEQKHPHTESKKGHDWLAQAKKLYHEGQYNQAAAAIGRVAHGDEPDPYAWAALIALKRLDNTTDVHEREQIIRTAQNHLDNAYVCLKAGEQSEQTRVDCLRASMEVLLAQGKAEEALTKVQEALKHSSATAFPRLCQFQSECFMRNADGNEWNLDEATHSAIFGLQALADHPGQWTEQQFQDLYKELTAYAPVRHDLSRQTISRIQDYANTCQERLDLLDTTPIPQPAQDQWKRHFQNETASCRQRIAWINQKAAQDAATLRQQLTTMIAQYQSLMQSHAGKSAEYQALLGKAQSMSNDGKPPKRHRIALVVAVILALVIVTAGTNSGMLTFILLLALEVPFAYLAWQGMTAGSRYSKLQSQIEQSDQELRKIADTIQTLQTTIQQTQERIRLADQDPSQYVLRWAGPSLG
ncbi:hypothetical protein [Bifidobacterium catulorum]|uniref:Uncharacterized protein n=1 Tax=Bifidobacterium catulorum TaxID=1630173 RepID=A0A2U2MUW0_9BIFI|nr:hypothetical protein [Bifidobacterium catulorum]PWG60602.1 hypothetical protein DF200_01620 [Bifidobacterium catulorum]